MSDSTAPLWINGSFCAASGQTSFESIDPARGSVLGTASEATAEDAARAIAAARNTFERSPWARSPLLRSAILLNFADRLERSSEDVAALLTAENGKLLAQSRGEIAIAVSELRYYAGLARNLFGRSIELAPGLHSELRREAAGVAAIIVPWNAPVVLLIRSLAPAIAAGCTVIIKAAPQTALINHRLMQLLAQDTQLPAGAVNSLTESGHAASMALVASPEVDVISYTGSTAVGKRIMAAAADTLKRLNLELGGSAPCLIFDDADLDAAVPALVSSALFITGQQCVAASRLLVHESLFDRACEQFSRALRNVRVGPGDAAEVDMGPLIDLHNRDRILRIAQDARTHADVLVEPRIPGGDLATGAFVTPGLLRIRDRTAPFLCEETFGPLLSIDHFGSDEEAVMLANMTRYGLAASVWSRDLRRSQRVAANIKSGTVWLNSHGRLLPETETGGYKQSGIGRLHGAEGLNDFLQTKHLQWQT